MLLPVAGIANGLVLAAIWRNPSLRAPSYIQLARLAFTDFCTGLISKPLWTANELPSCAMFCYCYFSTLLQSVSNNSSASTSKSDQRDVPNPSSTSDQLFKKSVFAILIILVLFYRTCLLVIVTIILLRVLLQNPNFMDQFFMCLFCLDICRPLSTLLYSCGE